MKNLTIRIDDGYPKESTEDCIGQIIISDESDPLNERFVMCFDSWTKEGYLKQWEEGIKRLKTENISCLVANVQELDEYPLVNIWPIYKEDEKLYIQNHLLFAREDVPLLLNLKNFDVSNCYEYIPAREIVGQDGRKISEWCINLQ